METLKTIALRKSTRKYKSEQISDKELEIIINAGCAAPVGMGDYKSLQITVIQNAELLDKIAKAAALIMGNPNITPLYGAPTLVIITTKPNEKVPGIEYASTSCIAENMALAATDLGLGSVYLLSILLPFKADKELLLELNLPDGFIPVCSIALGYPTEPLTEEKVLKQTVVTNVIK